MDSPSYDPVQALWEALRATGADLSGYDDWRHWAKGRRAFEMAAEVRDEVELMRVELEELQRELTVAEMDAGDMP